MSGAAATQHPNLLALLFLLWVTFAGTPLPLVAQTTSTLRGTVINQQPLPSEIVTTTDAMGSYRIPGLQPGTYTLRVEQPGFGVKRYDSVIVFRLALLLAALCGTAILGYMAGIRNPAFIAGEPPKTYNLTLNGVILHLTVGTMGVAVIFTLTMLLAAAVLLAGAAIRRRRQAEAANRELTNEIRERRSAEEEVNKLNMELERRVVERTGQLDAANKELEAFSYSVAHDLRAPLRHINGFAKILEDEYGPALDATAQHYLKRVRNGANNMGQLLDDLLKMGRVSRQELACRPTDLNSLVESALLDLQPECEGRQIDWRIAHLPSVQCDPGLMKQVFANLLSNAVKYTRRREKAVIEVGQVMLHGAPVVFIRDNGAGFDQQYVHKLFGVFQRLHPADEFEGTGVGLATVQRIVQKHGGWTWAEAEVDKGATFFFALAASSQGSANGTKSAAGGEP
jgi:signal transduction histidine kinase